MSSSVTVRPVRGVRGIGLFAIIVGIIMILAGGVTYGMVTSQLRDENITVSDGAQFFVGKRVQDPLTAYAQAEVINEHALAMTDGKTYAELAQDDPRRDTVMNASFLRASLYTSVVAFGVALLVVACGLLFLLVGIALRRLGKGEVSVLGVVPVGAVSGSATGAPVAPTAPEPPAAPLAPQAAAPAAPVVPPVERTSSRPVGAPGAAPVEAPPSADVPSTQTAPTTPDVPSGPEPSGPSTPSAPPRTTLPADPSADPDPGETAGPRA